jgi:hypothetical protein
MKMAALITGILVACLAICWATGLVEFTYPKVVPNEPLLHAQKVRSLDGTNMILESGETIALWQQYLSDRSAEEISMDISNQLSRGGFEVDVDPKPSGRLEIFVRWPRKFRDSVPPFTIPIIPQTVGRKFRNRVAFGTYLNTNTQPTRVGSETNRTSPTGP